MLHCEHVTRSTHHVARVATAVLAAVLLSRLPFRSHALFSWDSGNYALAMERIDIAAHRPHPPGYLGYVLIARALDRVLHDANSAFVAWNIVAMAAAALLFARLAADVAAGEARPRLFTIAAVSLFLTSPLLWFYSEIAEIYVSELLGTLLIAFCVWRVRRGETPFLYLCAIAVPLAAVFKPSAAIFMAPLAAIAWPAVPSPVARRGFVLFLACGVACGAAFLVVAPELITVTRDHYIAATAASRLSAAPAGDLLERLNQNARDTLLASVGMLGIVNGLALVAWTIIDRRLPRLFERTVACLWILPWFFLCIVIHLGKPGYVVPALPGLALTLAGFYARLRPPVAATLVALQAVANIAHFAAAGQLSESITGGSRPYRSKTVVQRLASDVQPLTFPTAWTIRHGDAVTVAVRNSLTDLCPEGSGIILTNGEVVDARRLMWYLPRATVVHLDGVKPLFIGRDGAFTVVRNEPAELLPNCPVAWLVRDDHDAPAAVPAGSPRYPGVGYRIDAHRVRVTAQGVRFE